MSHEQFRKVYQPGKQLSVDKSLILFKSRLHFKQYIKTQRNRFGIKLYDLTTSNGITLDLLVYHDKGTFSGDDPNSDMPTTECIPSVMMELFLGKGHILFTDNYYTSPSFNSQRQCFIRQKMVKQAMLACKYRSYQKNKSKQLKIVHIL